MENNEEKKEPLFNKAHKHIKGINAIINDPESKNLVGAIKYVFKAMMPSPLYKLIGDLSITIICISSVIYCAHNDFIEKGNVQSLLSLIIGALIGSRFKSS